VEEQKVLHLL